MSYPLRIAVVQFCPQFGKVKANIAKATKLCSKIEPGSVDILCFPEMAFTGYVFDSAKSILPYLEDPKTGLSSVFYSNMAKKLGCYVAGGFPERLAESERGGHEINVSQKLPLASEIPEDVPQGRPRQTSPSNVSRTDISLWPHTTRTPVGANSASIYGPDGEWFGGYRKTHLFTIDETWAKPGTGFGTFSLPFPGEHPLDTRFLKVTLGICMDLNPQPPLHWTSDDGPYELADHCEKHQSQLLLLLNAWLRSDLLSTEESSGAVAGDPDSYTLKYWAHRLRPLWSRYHRSGSDEDSDENGDENGGKHDSDETTVVVCNRTGVENGYTFAGSSALYHMRPMEDRPTLIETMGCDEEGVRMWTVAIREESK